MGSRKLKVGIVGLGRMGARHAHFSGGIFVDCSIEDIDLALWFFGDEATVKSVSAVGIPAISPELRQYDDCDNAVGIVEFYSGQVAHLFCSRMMAVGQEDSTEVIGTEGKLAVNPQPASNLVNIYEPSGITREISPHYYGQFRDAFITEANESTACCLDDAEPLMRLEGAVNAVEIGCAPAGKHAEREEDRLRYDGPKGV